MGLRRHGLKRQIRNMKETPLPPITDEVITAVRDRIVDAYEPEAIWVFGSAARGETGGENDLDLLILKAVPEGVSYYDYVAGIRELFWDMMVPMDIFVLDRETFERWRDTPGRLAYTVAREGRRVHG